MYLLRFTLLFALVVQTARLPLVVDCLRYSLTNRLAPLALLVVIEQPKLNVFLLHYTQVVFNAYVQRIVWSALDRRNRKYIRTYLSLKFC